MSHYSTIESLFPFQTCSLRAFFISTSVLLIRDIDKINVIHYSTGPSISRECVCQLPCARLDQCSSTTTDLEKAEKALPALLSIDGLIKNSTLGVSSAQLAKTLARIVLKFPLIKRKPAASAD